MDEEDIFYVKPTHRINYVDLNRNTKYRDKF